MEPSEADPIPIFPAPSPIIHLAAGSARKPVCVLPCGNPAGAPVAAQMVPDHCHAPELGLAHWRHARVSAPPPALPPRPSQPSHSACSGLMRSATFCPGAFTQEPLSSHRPRLSGLRSDVLEAEAPRSSTSNCSHALCIHPGLLLCALTNAQ